MKTLSVKAAAVLLAFVLTGCASGGLKKVTYMEINDRGCYVCQRMEPIIDEIEKQYGNEINITTYSGTSESGMDIVKKYNIKKFPANIFLDETGMVFFRHEGLLDIQAIKSVLKTKGIYGPQALTQTSAEAVTPGAGLK